MKTKMYSILDFTSFFTKVKSQSLPFKISYRLTLLAQEIEKHVNYYQEQFRDVLFKYGLKNENGELIPTEDGKGICLKEETMEEAYLKIAELRELEVELPNYTFSADDFDNIELSPEEMLAIIPFIKG